MEILSENLFTAFPYTIFILLLLLLLLLLSCFSRVQLYATHRQQPTRLPHRWDSPGRNTAVGCHVLLQCMKVRSESEFAHSCPTLSDPMDCRLPSSSVHGFSRQEYWSGMPLPSASLLTQFSQFSSVTQLCPLRTHESQHARPPCPSPTPGVHSNSCPSSR